MLHFTRFMCWGLSADYRFTKEYCFPISLSPRFPSIMSKPFWFLEPDPGLQVPTSSCTFHNGEALAGRFFLYDFWHANRGIIETKHAGCNTSARQNQHARPHIWRGSRSADRYPLHAPAAPRSDPLHNIWGIWDPLPAGARQPMWPMREEFSHSPFSGLAYRGESRLASACASGKRGENSIMPSILLFRKAES